jgi:hypothetical protein
MSSHCSKLVASNQSTQGEISLRRIIILGTAVTVLLAVSVAVAVAATSASTNTYTAGFSFKPNKAGSKHKPVPVSFVETLGAANATAGDRAAPLTDIKTSVYGMVSNAKHFPTCNGLQMTARQSDSFCPKGALVATGPVNSLLGGTDLTKPGSACNPFLTVWNGGHGTLWFFFTTGGVYQCGSLKTGATAAYAGHITQHGKYMVTDVPLPADISTSVAHINGLYGSLIKEVLTFKNLKVKVHHKTIGINESIGCLKGKRPFSVSYTATTPSGSQTNVVKGSTKC